MTLGEAIGLDDDREQLLVRILQAVLASIAGYGLITLRPELVLNAVVPLAVTVLPAALRREYDYAMDAGLVLLITVASVLHALGSLGLYVAYPWYDEVTHTVSAVLVAGIGYAVLTALERHSGEISLPPKLRGVFILVFVLAGGVLWEVFEFGAIWVSGVLGVTSPVQVFGIDDVVTDMVFNAVGAVLVAIWGTGYFDDLVPFLERRLR
jgi:hypothetical protein